MFVIKWWLDKVAAHCILIWNKSFKSLNLWTAVLDVCTCCCKIQGYVMTHIVTEPMGCICNVTIFCNGKIVNCFMVYILYVF